MRMKGRWVRGPAEDGIFAGFVVGAGAGVWIDTSEVARMGRGGRRESCHIVCGSIAQTAEPMACLALCQVRARPSPLSLSTTAGRDGVAPGGR